MRINHFAQADIPLKEGMGRFWMDTCGGRDQVAMAVLKNGWESYEAPMPRIVAEWSHAFAPIFVDVGANTGFYSLLALASGAQNAHAFEPVAEIADILSSNMCASELASRATIHRCALGEVSGEAKLYFPHDGHGLIETSASLSKEFRAEHSKELRVAVEVLDEVFASHDIRGSQMLLKIDVETCETSVLRGAKQTLSSVRPVIFAEILPGIDTEFFTKLCEDYNYVHFALGASGLVESAAEINTSLKWRDHCFLPAETSKAWLQCLN